MTTVVRIKRKNNEIIQDCDVYIGRSCFMGGWNLFQSKWATPYSTKEYGTAEKANEKYRQYIKSKPELMASLHELKGKKIGCWCAPNPCHGDVLVELVNNLKDNEPMESLDCPIVKFTKTRDDAVTPTKGTKYSVGFDLTAVYEAKKLTSRTTLYGTGIRVQPESFDYYTEIVPRSSISKTGYMLANSVGTIDSDYTGELFIALTKIDESMPDLTLPFKLCQLILKKAEFYRCVEDASFLDTERGEGGFGSTNK